MTKLVGIDGSAVDVEIPVVNVGLLLGRSGPQLRAPITCSRSSTPRSDGLQMAGS